VAIWALITGSFDSTSARLVGSALAAALATLSGLAGATALGRTDRRHTLGQATIAVSCIALALAAALIWIPAAEDSETIARALGISIAAMIAGAHASLMLSRLAAEDASAVQTLTKLAVGSASLAALLMSCLLLFVSDGVASGVWRLFGVLIVIAVLTTLLTPLARRMAPTTNPARPTE
jgi:fucose 4-O-acetylase-like acetyltransferase